ncbi:MAG TPA: S26 family signal peptidase [Candidatus Limnocylindria bacterium]|nr:S26 family signal peptidase [Candidatus Limnocylindria bacterium]
MRTGLALGMALAIAWILARRRLDTVEVRGRSMAPALLPGDRLLVARVAPRLGEVALARDPREPNRELVKRVAGIGPEGVRLLGDNPALSTDARAFGAVPVQQVEWRAVLRYWPVGRVGRIQARPVPLVPIDEGGEPACAFPEALIAGS